MEYIAFKLKDFDHWLWFEQGKVTEDNGRVVGLDGWGKDGALTSMEVGLDQIEGRIESNTLQY